MNSLKGMRSLLIAAAIAVSTVAFATDVAPKYIRPDAPAAGKICAPNQAATYTLQCDPGTRYPIEEVFVARAPGVSLCRVVRTHGCTPIAGFHPSMERGFEVREAFYDGELVSVTFGLERLLGEWPPR